MPEKFYTKRTHPQTPDIRGEFFRDQTKIIHSLPFRRLKHKTQVFFAPDNDHICTRIEHVLHVATIAATICKGLNNSKCGWALNSEMAYAIGLAHDLGHAPFGHSGEESLNKKLRKHKKQFIHEINSYRVAEYITNYGKGLNLTYGVKDGIIAHNGENFNDNNLKPVGKPNVLAEINSRKCMPSSYEGCIVRLSDKIAYLGRDIEDAIKAGFIKRKDIPFSIRKNLSKSDNQINTHIIKTLTLDVIENSKNKECIGFSKRTHQLAREIGKFNKKRIYSHPSLLEYGRHIDKVISELFDYFFDLFEMHSYDYKAYKKSKQEINVGFGKYIENMKPIYELKNEDISTVVTDYISGMTDTFALSCFETLSLPEPIKFKV